LIGIKAEDGQPVCIKGIPYSRGISEKITSICLDRINPPTFPEIKVCKIPRETNKVVVLLRIEESDITPHRVEQDTKIYIRVANQSVPILARYEEIEWLRERRRKAVENRERLINRAESRFKSWPSGNILQPYRRIYLIPLYPKEPMINVENIDSIIQKAGIQIPYNGGFPNHLSNSITQYESLIRWEQNELNNTIEHIEINQFGLIWHKESFVEKFDNHLKEKIYLPYILYQIIEVLLIASRFYKKIGYWGNLEISYKLENIKGRPIIFKLRDYAKYSSLLDNEVEITTKFKAAELNNENNIIGITLGFIKLILWSCGRGKAFNITKFHKLIKDMIDNQFKL
ncbi:MAG: AlbA family DNA-binding domain-containing protein, partial [Candidatus Njordarchaeales archaeon]